MRTVSIAVATALAASACLLAVPTAASAAPACGNNALEVTATAEQGATGHANFVLLFRNKTPQPCTLFGYPGLDALDASGQVIKHAHRTLTGFTGGSTRGCRRFSSGPATSPRPTSSG